MKSVEQNCEKHAKHKPEFDVFSVIVACKLHNLAACCAHWIVQHLMIILMCTGDKVNMINCQQNTFMRRTSTIL